jgi:hypothetical protein
MRGIVGGTENYFNRAVQRDVSRPVRDHLVRRGEVATAFFGARRVVTVS